MSFAGLLREIVEGCGGGIGAVLMGSDGIPIEQVVVGPIPQGPLADDLATAGVEFGRILDDIRKASDALSGGGVRETLVVLDRFTLLFRTVDGDLFLVLVLAPDANIGKARYLIRRQLPAVRRNL
jgi:predicted regulator of Ras-like GTPase activity (Roadblock/LC7/MglB family)